MTENQNQTQATQEAPATKFCSECGQKIAARAVVCPHCGCAVGEMPQAAPQAAPQIIVNNTNTNTNVGVVPNGKAKNKWVALLIWWFFGYIGGHKFYEGRIGMGILYFITGGIFGIGYIIDFWALLFKSNPYYV